MKTVIIIFVFCLMFSYASAQGCSANPCQLGDYFNEINGYRCIDLGGDSVTCTCPGSAYEINQPCRLCDNADPSKDACRNLNGKLIKCLENTDCGTSYACLCTANNTDGFALTTDADCDTTVPLTCSSTTTTTTTTTITTPSGPSPCLNGGTYDGSICQCPPSTWGDYCELNGTLGFCSARHCSNGGFCRENIINTTVFVYCQCQPGYRGTKCETNYFTCSTVGNFSNTDMHEQGKYFECKMIAGLLRIERKSCPKRLRFDQVSNVCM
ncbi:unnamed protein product [Adineta steineri]|uniref:EGF-like domain-containing protein n=1 Tax=Adineta steineri TaxID=433720 RepID=A0A813TCG9_9BILA|nr:unnamed protein product [Adineta steineri]CAF1564608.1 unnamed protein product [Adineta steineri]